MHASNINRIIDEEIRHNIRMGAICLAAAMFAAAGFAFLVWRNYIRRSTGVCVIAFIVFGWLGIRSLQEARKLRLLKKARAITNPEDLVSVNLIGIEKKLPVEIKPGLPIPPGITSVDVKFTLQNGIAEQYRLQPKFVSALTRELLLAKPALAH